MANYASPRSTQTLERERLKARLEDVIVYRHRHVPLRLSSLVGARKRTHWKQQTHKNLWLCLHEHLFILKGEGERDGEGQLCLCTIE